MANNIKMNVFYVIAIVGVVVTNVLCYDGTYFYSARDGYVPPNAVSSGLSIDGEIFVGATEHNGTYVPAMLNNQTKLVYYSYNGSEYQTEFFDVLCLDYNYRYEWKTSGLGQVPANAVSVGRFFVGRVWFDEKPSVGRVVPTEGVALFPRSGEEMRQLYYDVLVSVYDGAC